MAVYHLQGTHWACLAVGQSRDPPSLHIVLWKLVGVSVAWGMPAGDMAGGQ